jgi:hypothetical protein
MNTPKIPGFTAEASMYKTSARYHALVAGSYRQTDGGISPQFRIWWPGMPGCNPNCVCISPVSCPCCIGPGPGGPITWPELTKSSSLF